MRLHIFLVLIPVFFLSLTATNAESTNKPDFKIAPCTLDFTSAYTVECGFLIVPEQRANSQGKTVQVAVALIHSKSQHPQSDPVIFVAGGPGNTLIEEVAQGGISPMIQSWLEQRDVILVDQRGVGSSQPSLACPAFDHLNLTGLNSQQAETKALTTFRGCADTLASQGIDLTIFNTRENVDDLAELPIALGYNQANYYGLSYGSYVVLNIMRFHPEHIRSVILEGVTPPDRNPFADYSVNFERALRQMITTCGSEIACSTAYPDLEQVTFSLISHLNEQPVSILIANSTTGRIAKNILTGDDIINTFRQQFRDPVDVRLMPAEIYAIAAQQFDGIMPFLQNQVFPNGDNSDPNPEVYYTYRCSDNVLGQPEAAVQEALADTNLSLQFYFRENARIGAAFCAHWPVKAANPQLFQPVISSIPALLTSGAFDPVTPPDYAQHVLETLANGHNFVFPTMGHGVAVSSDLCAIEMISAFLAGPSTAPNANCITKQASIQFSLPG